MEFNSTGRWTNITRNRGVDLNQWALYAKQDYRTIRVIFWGAICLGYKGPCHVLEKDTVEDQQRRREIPNQENQIRQQCQTQNQAQASIPGTWQHKALMEINRNNDEQNIIEGREGWRKRCWRAPQQEFRDEQFQYCSKGGVNWVSYSDRVLNPFLYP